MQLGLWSLQQLPGAAGARLLLTAQRGDHLKPSFLFFG